MDSWLNFSPFSTTLRGRSVTFRRPVIMGILNATPDSFYDGGRYTTPSAVLAHARQLLAQGADIIDLGVVSSRPGAQLLDPHEEASRLVPLVRLLRQELPSHAILSVDTCYSLPAAKAVEAGADIINDISGGQFDPDMFATVAHLKVPYIARPPLSFRSQRCLARPRLWLCQDPRPKLPTSFPPRRTCPSLSRQPHAHSPLQQVHDNQTALSRPSPDGGLLPHGPRFRNRHPRP